MYLREASRVGQQCLPFFARLESQMQYPRNRRNRYATLLQHFPLTLSSSGPFRFPEYSGLTDSEKWPEREYGFLLMGGNDYERRRNRLIPFSSPAHVSVCKKGISFIESEKRKVEVEMGMTCQYIIFSPEERPSPVVRGGCFPCRREKADCPLFYLPQHRGLN